MCLLFPKNSYHANLEADKRGQVIERLGEALTQMGMFDVKTRPTARIPIVEFKDPINGSINRPNYYFWRTILIYE